MSSIDEPWEPWASAMLAVNAVDPRTVGEGRTPRPSWTQLAELAGVSTTAVTNAVVRRTRNPRPEVVQAIASALRVQPDTVSGWIGLRSPVRGPWDPPQEAALLSPVERQALGDFIRAITLGRREERGSRAAPMNQDVAPPEKKLGVIIPAPSEATAARPPHSPAGEDPRARRG